MDGAMKRLLGALCLAVATVGLARAQVTHDVAVGPGGAFVFDPADIEIEVGDTVRWTWGSLGHNVVSDGAAAGAFSSGAPAGPGTVFEVTFDQDFVDTNPVPGGVYDYVCVPHLPFGMTGSVTVMIPVVLDEFSRGDCNADGAQNIADAVAGLDALFSGGSVPCIDACDLNDDGGFDIADVIFTLSNLFSGGPDPAAPFPDCGTDPTADGLGCDTFPCP